MSLTLSLFLSLAAAQPATGQPAMAQPATGQPAPAPQPPVAIRPGDYSPESRNAVPITEVAQPLGLAIASFDADGDARTTRAEYEQGLERTFAAADTNRDGVLGYLEYSAWALTWLGSQNALPGPFAIDADGDDRLSRTEFLNEFGRQFIRLDANADGAITHAELLSVRNPRARPMTDRELRRLNPQRRDRR